MRKLLTLLILGSVLIPAQAQLVKFGLKVGFGSSELLMDDVPIQFTNPNNVDVILKKGDGVSAFQFGLMTEIKIPVIPLTINPEFNFSGAGGKILVQDNLSQTTDEVNNSYGRFEIPIIVNLKLGPARIFAGPYVSWIIKKNDGVKNYMESRFGLNVQEDPETRWGFQAGVGVSLIKHLRIDLRYQENFGGEVGYDASRATLLFEPSTREIMLSLGWWLNGD